MADEATVTTNTAVAAPVTAPAPVADVAPVVAPVTTTVEAPVTTTTTVVETPTPTPITTVLGEQPKEITTTEPVKTEESVVKTENVEGQSEEPASPPVYDPFTLPEGITLDETRIKDFTEILSELEKTGKADHAAVQEFGQKAVDFHIAEVQKAVESLNQLYHKSWDDTKVKWKDDFLSDPEIGGNRFQTTIDAANNFIRTHGGTAEQQAEFRQFMNDSGVGNHKTLIRLLANAGSKMSEGKPLAATVPISPPKSRVEALYGKNK